MFIKVEFKKIFEFDVLIADDHLLTNTLNRNLSGAYVVHSNLKIDKTDNFL